MIRRLFYLSLGALLARSGCMRRLQALHPQPRGPHATVPGGAASTLAAR